jgi:hypothetical protein
MNSNSKFFAPINNQESKPYTFMRNKTNITIEPNESDFLARMRATKLQDNIETSKSKQNNFASCLSSNKHTSEKEPDENDFIARMRANKSESTKGIIKAENNKLVDEEKQDTSEEFLLRLMQKRGVTKSSSNTYASILGKKTEVEIEVEIDETEYIEKMRQKRLESSIANSKLVTTVTFDVRNNSESLLIEKKELVIPDEDENEESYSEDEDICDIITAEDIIMSVVYDYEREELLKTTPSISKENMINFLSKQGENGGFDPVEAYHNTLTVDSKNLLKEETIRKNITGCETSSKQTENEKLIADLSSRKASLTKAEKRKLEQAEKDEKARKKLEKEVARAMKGPSKKIQDMIDKKDIQKAEKKISDEESNLQKLQDEIKKKRIKTIYDAANWVVIMNSHENKINALEILFLGLTDSHLKKVIYIEIIRRVQVSEIKSKKFKSELEKFGTIFTPEEMIKYQLKEMEDIIPPFSPFEKKVMSLDSWQLDVFNLIKRKCSILIDAPTSSGKTVCATFCVKVCKKVLFVLPSKELANQVAGTIRNMKSKTSNYIPIKLITGENIYEDSNPKVYIGTAVDLERYFNINKGKRIDWENPDDFTADQFNIDSFEYIIVDEIHQMNSEEQGPAMQRLIKQFKCPMLGLSATIGNPEKIKDWISYLKESTPNIEVERISYDKRFINQQKHLWNGTNLEAIHPLAVTTIELLQSEKFISVEMQFIPNDLFRLYSEMVVNYPSDAILSVKPDVFFENACISLNQCKEYEIKMKQLLTKLSHSHTVQTEKLLEKFKIPDVKLESLEAKDVYQILKKLQVEKKLPAIVFKFDPTTCKKVAHELLEYMETEEQLKYPHYRELRELQNKYYKMMQDEINRVSSMDYGKVDDVENAKYEREMREREKYLNDFISNFKSIVSHNINKYQNELDRLTIKQPSRELDRLTIKQPSRELDRLTELKVTERCKRLEFYIEHYSRELINIDSIRELKQVNVFAPHPDFTFSNVTVCMSTMIEIKNLLKEYTEQIVGNQHINKKKLANDFNIGYNHFFLKSIERGFVVYLNALPTPFQRIGQMLIADGGASVTFSDESLAYGVNYPIRSVVLFGSTKNDIIDRSKAHQASGRSGRRGLDTKGHTVYVGVNWKDLMSSEYINVIGSNPDNEYMTLPYEFNKNFDMKRLAKTSLEDFCKEESLQAIKEIENERLDIIQQTHDDLVERLGINNFMQIYRLSSYGIMSEILIKFLNFLSNKMHSGLNIDKYDLFEMLGCLTDIYKEEPLEFENTQNQSIMFDFQSHMAEKDHMIQLYGFNKITKCYKKQLFDYDISLTISRLKYLNEIIRILYNQTCGLKKTNKWVDMLLQIFIDIKSHIFKNTI